MRGDFVKLVEETIIGEKEKPPVDHQARIDTVEKGREEGGMGYTPGATAIGRGGRASTIAQYIEKADLIPEGSKILHAGAGRPDNPDRAYLDTKGEAYHYDPGQDSSNDRSPLGKGDFDVVVSPFVLNVLSLEGREMPMKDMVRSLKPDGSAIVGVRGPGDVPLVDDKGKAKKPNWTPWSDGWLVPKGNLITFQKGISNEELKTYLSKYFHEVEIIKNKSSNSVPLVKASRPKR